MTERHERYRRYLETLTPESLAQLSVHVTPDVRFKDPFNDVRGVESMAAIFQHMFENIPEVRFTVRHVMAEGDNCLMTWRFEGKLRGRAWGFDGASALRFAPDGRVAEHIDYWDAAENFYEHLPLIGCLLRRIRRRLSNH
jgi:steroid delta-isomerase